MKNKKVLLLVLLFVFFLGLAGISYAAEASAKNFPLAKGNAWKYEGVLKFAVEGEEKEKKMAWEMKVIDSVEKDGATAALVTGYPGMLTFYEDGKETLGCLLINNGGKLLINASEPDCKQTFADVASGAKKIDELSKSSDLLIDNSQLKKGNVYGFEEGAAQEAKDSKLYCWSVNDEKKFDAAVKGFNAKECMQYSLSYTSRPDTTSFDFVPGLGFVNFEYVHHGTPGDVSAKLVEFSSVAQTAAQTTGEVKVESKPATADKEVKKEKAANKNAEKKGK